MSADIIPFARPVLEATQAKCFSCGLSMTKRMDHDEPAFCSGKCAVFGQPAYVKKQMHGTGAEDA